MVSACVCTELIALSMWPKKWQAFDSTPHNNSTTSWEPTECSTSPILQAQWPTCIWRVKHPFSSIFRSLQSRSALWEGEREREFYLTPTHKKRLSILWNCHLSSVLLLSKCFCRTNSFWIRQVTTLHVIQNFFFVKFREHHFARLKGINKAHRTQGFPTQNPLEAKNDTVPLKERN